MRDRLASLTEVAVVSGFAEPNAPIPTMADKTNAVRMLDRMRISYELREYPVDPEDLAGGDCGCKDRHVRTFDPRRKCELVDGLDPDTNLQQTATLPG